MIGTELLLGQIVDTTAAFMGTTLAENGISLFQKTTVGDNPERIRRALEGALQRSNVVLTSGGLGPTEDDITRECIAELFDLSLEFRQDLYEQLAARFAQFRRPMSENNRKQAFAPRGAVAIKNPNGTAPGLIVGDSRGVIIAMPGVPGELKPMLVDSVIPYLREQFGIAGVIRWRVLKVCGVGESSVDTAIGHLIRTGQNPTVGVLASPDAVRIRITARADSVEEAEQLIDTVDIQVRALLPGLIMGVDDETLEGVVDGLIDARGWRLALAETQTGGMLAQRLSAADAKSFAGGHVLPSAAPEDEPLATARGMAEEARARFKADCAIGLHFDHATHKTTGLFVCPDGDVHWEASYPGTDTRSQMRVAVVSLEQVRRFLTGAPTPDA